MVKAEAVQLYHVIVVEGVKDLAPILATAHQAQLAQPAQLVRHGRFTHLKLRGKLTDIPFAFQQNGNDPQAGRVTQGAEQVSQTGGGLFS
jgi:hypothetical protein